MRMAGPGEGTGESRLARGSQGGEWPARPARSESSVTASNFVKIQPSWMSRDGGDATRGDIPRVRAMTGARPSGQTIGKSRSTAHDYYAPEDVLDLSASYDSPTVRLPPVSPGKRSSAPNLSGSLARASKGPRASLAQSQPRRSEPAAHSSSNDGRALMGSSASRGSLAAGSWGGFDAGGSARSSRRSAGGDGTPEGAGIFTSNDVIEYYVKNGLGAPIKVFYCVDAPRTEDSFTPYDLLVVPKNQVQGKNVEHYTVSSSGVVHIRPGVQSEFTPLGEWMRDSSVFSLLRQMKYFKMYLVGKTFKIWRANVRRRLYEQVRRRIERSLFLTKPTFSSTVAELGALCAEVRYTPAIVVDPQTTYQVDDFREIQERQRANVVVPAMESCQERAAAALERVIKRTVDQVQEYTKMMETNDSIDAMVSKTKSLVAMKRERQERARGYKRIVEESQMLPNLVRLADLMLTEALAAMVQNSMDGLLHVMRHPDPKSKGVLSTTVQFAHELTTFTPDAKGVMRCINEAVVDELVEAIGAMPRLVFMRAFTPLFDGLENHQGFEGTQSPMQVLTTHPNYTDARAEFSRFVESSFEKSVEYAKQFEDLRVVYKFGLSWNQEEYEQKPKDLPTFRADMRVQRNWVGDLDKMRLGGTVGVVYVDAKTLRGDLHSTVTSMLEAMKALLLVAAREESTRVGDAFAKRIKTMEPRPDDLAGFMTLVDHAQTHERSRKEYNNEHKIVEDMYGMLVNYDMRIPAMDGAKLDDLNESVSKFKGDVDEAKEFIESKTPAMMKTLKNDAADLEEELFKVQSTLNQGVFMEANADAALVMEELAAIKTTLDAATAQVSTYKRYQQLFDLEEGSFDNLKMATKEFDTKYESWNGLRQWQLASQHWLSAPCLDLVLTEINNTVDETNTAAFKMLKLRRDDQVVMRLREEIDAFKRFVPLLQEVANPALLPRHWQRIMELMEQPYDEDKPTSLQNLVDWGVEEKMEGLENIGAAASKEYSLLQTLNKMMGEWAGMEFRCVPYKESGTYILGGSEEVQALLDDQIVKAQGMCASPFVKPFEQDAKNWSQVLNVLQDMLDNWLKVQSTWLYLEPIFSSEDIVKQMPEEGEKFAQVDAEWRDIMNATKEAPDVIAIGNDKERLNRLVDCNELLDEIQKGLAAYLEKKRLFFPRFFFLSNDEMLEILSETKDPTKVQPHLKKCFEGIAKLKFSDGEDGHEEHDILAMISEEKEEVPLKEIISVQQANGAVEKWLLQVEAAMFDNIAHITGEGITSYGAKPRDQWVLDWPGMVVLVVTAVFWTKQVTEAISDGTRAVGKYEERCTSDLMKIVDRVRGELTSLQRKTLGALVVMDVHARDVVANLAKNKVSSPTDFDWQAQLRSYWEEDASGARDFTAIMRIMSAEVEYGYEYLGNSSRLVITPLTDRCYRTLMGAIHLTMGGAPEGPAGTGKTETTKDLAKALARQCVVFNCSDSMDYIQMGKFFKGLASSGAWACFDEFNRIDLEVLSVVAQQVLDIQRAIAARVTSFIFEGTEIGLKYSAWCSITMNPGYAGRSELPDNLKALFRTVAMMVPDYAMIGEIILYSFGYLEARDCATKIVQCYKLCSEQLSSQDHYDYGMRAVMAVLRAAGNLKRRFPDEDEHVLMLRSIIDVNLCKFLSQDVPLFEGIISDLFPGVVLPKSDYTLMEKAMREACAEMNLQEDPYFYLKTTQLYEMIVVRHGLMLVGAPFSGKTMSYRVLARALSIMAERGEEGQVKCEYHCVNPKSITMGQLYGQNDPQTHEWQDGVLAKVYKGCASDPSPNRKWVMLDGPVDAIWIENMNTVLDDNKKLCLNSGEIVAMSSVMNMIFEVNDLAVASPATVSRCGMVYLEPHQLGWRPLCLSWLNTFPETIKQSFKDRVLALFDWLVPVSIRFMKREIKEVAETTYEGTNVAVNLMRTFKSLLVEQLADPKGLIASIKRPSDMEKHIDSCFVFCLAWSIGGTANSNEGRLAFDEFVRVAYKGELDLPHGDNTVYQGPSGEKYNLPEDIPEGHMTTSTPLPPDEVKTKDPEGNLIPTRTTIYDFRWDVTKSEWVPWENDIDKSPIPPEMAFKQIIVPTVDTVRYLFLADLSIQYNNPILFCGPTGTGKSVYMQGHLMGMDKEKWAPPNFVGFSAKTSSNITQYLIDAKLDKRRKGYYGPPIGKRMAIMVDDLNMPQKEVYGAQPPIELLRQYMDHGGWYDRENNFRNMQDCLFVAAMGPPGGGRSPITQRYQRHYNLLSIVEFDSKALEHIFGTILAWFYKTKEFPKDIQKLQKSIIAATLDVYNTSISKLLPTPAKSHYTFNLRDVSRVVEGLTLQNAEGIKTGLGGVGEHYRLWVHETLRVFYDRLVDDEDRSWFLEYIKELTETHFGQNFNELFAHLDMDGDGTVDAEELRHCMFGDFMGDDEPDSQGGDRLYDEITDMKEVVTRLEEYLVDYNGMSKSPMNLAMFLYAAEHVARIARVLKQPGAHLLAVGVGGSGRQSLSRLAAFIMGMESFQIAISKSYTTVEWKEDLKKFCRAAGAEGRPCVFLFSDSQIKDESYVEDINNLLNSGEVPNLFPYDERAAVMEQCRVRAKKAGQILESAEELWHYFIASCKANLHIILCFSPIGEAFRERLRQFPSLVNCCTIDWFREWPNDALEAVASKILADVDVPAEERQKLLVMCKSFHKGVGELSEEYLAKEGRHNYVTPTSYLELLNMFTSLLAKQREAVSSAKRRYEVGLEKLAFTADAVRDMQDELTALKPNLIKTVAETEELMEKVQREKVEVVEPKKAAVDEEVAEAAKKGEAAGAVKKECEDLLAEAIPALEAAVAALDTITDKDIKYVNSFKSPPAMIKLVLESVCVALAVKPAKVPDPAGTGKMIEDYWPPSKKLLMDPTFIDQLRGYDKDNIDPVIMEKLRTKYIADETYSIEKAEKAAAAAAGLCKWVFAMDSYDRVAKIVAPKQLALAEAEAEYQKIMDALKEKQDNLADIMGKLAAMEQQLEDSVNEKKRLEDEVDLCTVKLERAESLIGGLGGEGERWKESAAKLGIAYENLTGDMLIAAGMISYLGTFTMAFRDGIADSWVSMCKESGIPSSPKFSLQDVLGDPVAIRKWGIAGLPNDSFSIDNGIMIANARRWPLMIDPQGQANKWIKNMERENNVQVIKLTDGDYLRTLENAIQFGLPVLLENVKEELDPSLEPLLLKQLFKSGGVMCIKLGESIIEFSDNFRFYITTSLRNPHYLPETAVKVTLLNFMITLDGLSDQLLGVVVAEERPDLEAQRQKLVVESADNKKRLKDIEDRILHTLSSSEGNILDDTAGIETLKEAKIVSDEITEKQIVAEATQVEIDAAREGYKPCGAYNSVLFFTIRDLANIDPMYQYSLAWFISLFVRSIHASAEESEDEDSGEPAEVDLDERLKIIAEHFTYSLYQNVCRSLFEKDKLLFSFLLCTRIMTSEGRLPVEEFNFFLTGGVGITAKSVPQPKGEEWISAKMWGEVTRLASTCSAFENLPDHIAQDTAAWKAIYDAVQPQEMTYPGEYGTQPTAFQKLLVMRCLRPDKVIPAVNDFVDATMGRRFIEPPPFDLQGSYNESNAMTPLLFILSAGSDPTAALLKFADEAGKGSDIGVISMGQGQGPKAAVLIEEGRETGKWVLLQNCHLAPSWMPSLEKICEGINAENTDEQFRLWLTSMPSPAFPVSILQNGVKMTNEPPRGLRANMRRSFQLEPIADEEFFEGCNKPEVFKKLCFGLAFCHGFVQERRSFGPIGWNIPYGFDDGDLKISVRQLQMYINENEQTPFEALKYATGECNYGGRVTDDKDRRLLNTLLRKVYAPAALKKGFRLSESGTYVIPEEGSHESYLDYIATLPILPLPEAFGLHENADITKDLGQTALLTETLIKTGGGSGGGGGAQDELVAKITKDIIDRLPPNFDIEAVQRKFPVRYEESMNTVLAQEMLRYNRLLSIIRNSLLQLQKAIAGLSVMSAELEKVFNSFAIGQVPAMWMGKSFPSLKPLGSYIEDLLARLDLFDGWYRNGQPSIFWISGFFFTPSFTTAALQNFARGNNYAIDTVGFEMEMMEMDPGLYTEPPDSGIYIHGLFMEGCAWDKDKKMLCESRPKVLFEPGPCIHLKPVLLSDIKDYPHYSCPVYRTAERRGVLATTGHSTNFLMMMKMPTDVDPDHWAMRGVAMLCSLKD